MAQHAPIVLPFPVAQTERHAVPTPHLLADWQVLHLHLTHELLRIARLGALLTAAEVMVLQGEWSLLARRLDAIESAVKTRTMAAAKAVGLIA